MIEGDLIEISAESGSRRFIVRSVTSRDGQETFPIAHLLDKDGKEFSIEANATESDGGKITCIGHPSTEWPYFQAKLQWVPDLQISRLRKLENEGTPLESLKDWVIIEPLRQVSTLFINPAIDLRPLERLLIKSSVQVTSIAVPDTFRSLEQRIERKKPKEKTYLDRLLDWDDE